MADAKITELTELTAPVGADVLAIVDDPSGTPVTKKITAANLAKAGNNFAASAAPAVTDDSSAGYFVGSRWVDTTNDVEYVCVDASAGAAVWLLASPPVDLWVGSYDPGLQTATTALAANTASLSSFQVHRRLVATKAYVRIGVQSGNIDVGVYNDSGTRLASTGSIACPAAALSVALTFTASTTLYPGRRYWAAVVADNGTVTWGTAGTQTAPSAPGSITNTRVSSSFPLPASLTIGSTQFAITFGVWVSAS